MFDYDEVVPENLRESLRSVRETAVEKGVLPCHKLNDRCWPYMCTAYCTELDMPMLSAYCLSNPDKCMGTKNVFDLI